MIGKISGYIDYIDSDHCLIDVNGVGYIIYTHSRGLTQLGGPGEFTSFWIEMQIREDAMTLYGFTDRAEQLWFRLLKEVQGVGAKAALSILQIAPPKQLQFALASQDKAMVQRADGVGPKLATRIVTELKDKAMNMPAHLNSSAGGKINNQNQIDSAENLSNNSSDQDTSLNKKKQNKISENDIDSNAYSESIMQIDPKHNEDAISALVNFGYGRSDAYAAVKKALDHIMANIANDDKNANKDNAKSADTGKEIELQNIIKLALKELNG